MSGLHNSETLSQLLYERGTPALSELLRELEPTIFLQIVDELTVQNMLPKTLVLRQLELAPPEKCEQQVSDDTNGFRFENMCLEYRKAGATKVRRVVLTSSEARLLGLLRSSIAHQTEQTAWEISALLAENTPQAGNSVLFPGAQVSELLQVLGYLESQNNSLHTLVSRFKKKLLTFYTELPDLENEHVPWIATNRTEYQFCFAPLSMLQQYQQKQLGSKILETAVEGKFPQQKQPQYVEIPVDELQQFLSTLAPSLVTSLFKSASYTDSELSGGESDAGLTSQQALEKKFGFSLLPDGSLVQLANTERSGVNRKMGDTQLTVLLMLLGIPATQLELTQDLNEVLYQRLRSIQTDTTEYYFEPVSIAALDAVLQKKSNIVDVTVSRMRARFLECYSQIPVSDEDAYRVPWILATYAHTEPAHQFCVLPLSKIRKSGKQLRRQV